MRASSWIVGLAVLALPLTARAQQSADTSSTGGSQTYEREVFRYPASSRDPFKPINAGQQLGPRFDDLELTGVIYNPNVGSVAVLLDRATGKRYRLHEGDTVGETRVVTIQPSEVDFIVSGFGVSRRETLQVKKREKEQQG